MTMAWRAFIRNNFWQKLWAMVLATLIWFTVHSGDPALTLWGTEESRIVAAVPVNVVGSGGEPASVQLTPPQVDVKVRGARARVRELQPADLLAIVSSGSPSAPGSAGSRVRVFAPDGVKIDSVSPPAVVVEKLLPAPPLHGGRN
jgi:hypothetical protein